MEERSWILNRGSRVGKKVLVVKGIYHDLRQFACDFHVEKESNQMYHPRELSPDDIVIHRHQEIVDHM
jgi:hypothetical protein